MNELDKNLLRDLSNYEVKLDKEELWGAIQTKQRRRAGLGYLSWLLGAGLIILVVYLTIPESLYLTEQLNTDLNNTEQLAVLDVTSDNTSSMSPESTASPSHEEAASATETSKLVLPQNTNRTSILNTNKQSTSIAHLFGQDKLYTTQELLRNNASGGDMYSQNLLSQVVFASPSKTSFIQTSPSSNDGRGTVVTSVAQTISTKKSVNTTSDVLFGTTALLNNKGGFNFIKSSMIDNNTYPSASYSLTNVIQKSPWVFNFDVAYGMAQKTLEAKSDDQIDYLAERIRTEQLKEEILVNAGFSYQYGNGFYVKFGLEAAQWVEEYSNATTDTEKITIDNVPTAVEVDAQGNSTTIYGQGTATLTTDNTRLLYNQYRSLDVPVLIGYAGTKGRWQYAIEAGLSMNAWFGLDGSLLDEDLNIASTESFYKESLGLSATGSAFIKYRLNQNAALYMGPSVKKPFNSMDLDSYSITQKMLYYRWRLGMEYRL